MRYRIGIVSVPYKISNIGIVSDISDISAVGRPQDRRGFVRRCSSCRGSASHPGTTAWVTDGVARRSTVAEPMVAPPHRATAPRWQGSMDFAFESAAAPPPPGPVVLTPTVAVAPPRSEAQRYLAKTFNVDFKSEAAVDCIRYIVWITSHLQI